MSHDERSCINCRDQVTTDDRRSDNDSPEKSMKTASSEPSPAGEFLVRKFEEAVERGTNEATDPPLTGKFYIRCVQGGGARVALHRDDGVSAVVECPAELVPEWHRAKGDDE